MIDGLKRYKASLAMALIILVLTAFKPDTGIKSLKISMDNLLQMVAIIPPIFILLGLLDVWVPKDAMIRWMGDKSGPLGAGIAFLLGSVAAGPLYAAFPVAGVFMRKGCRFFNVLVFIGAWSTTKIPLVIFEASVMGWKFMAIRFLLDLPVIVLIAFLTEKLIGGDEMDRIYRKALGGA